MPHGVDTTRERVGQLNETRTTGRWILYGVFLIAAGALTSGFLDNILSFANWSPVLFNATLSLARFGLLPAGAALLCAGILLRSVENSANADDQPDIDSRTTRDE
jgi:hypothetical protein